MYTTGILNPGEPPDQMGEWEAYIRNGKEQGGYDQIRQVEIKNLLLYILIAVGRNCVVDVGIERNDWRRFGRLSKRDFYIMCWRCFFIVQIFV